MNATSINAVAERAGVSKSTVSRVINDAANVSPDAFRSVREAMTAMGYKPERRKRSGRRRVFAGKGVVGNVAALVLGQPLADLETRGVAYWQTLETLGPYLRDRKLNMLLFSENDLDRALETPIDGLFLLGRTKRLPEKLRKFCEKTPGVILSSQCSDPDMVCDRVEVHHATCGALAARYLLDRGYRKIAVYNPYRHHRLNESAAALFVKTCEDNGVCPIRVIDDFETAVPFPEKARILGGRLAEAAPEGVFVTYSERAVELYPVLREHGIEPGRDLDVVTYTNIGFETPETGVLSAWAEPNYALIARKGVEQLFWRLENMNEINRVTTLIEPTLFTNERTS